MKKNNPKTISIQQFTQNFTTEQKSVVATEIEYYQLLTQFKEARESKGITQEELAEKAGINRTTLSKIESGMRNATIETMSKLAQALDLRLELRLS